MEPEVKKKGKAKAIAIAIVIVLVIVCAIGIPFGYKKWQERPFSEAEKQEQERPFSEAEKQELINTVSVFDPDDIADECRSNYMAAGEKYDGKIVRVNDLLISEIYSDHFSRMAIYPLIGVDVYLDDEDLLKIGVGGHVDVIGVLKITNGDVELDKAFIVYD